MLVRRGKLRMKAYGNVQICEAVPENAKAIAVIEEACFTDPWSMQGIIDALTYSYSTMLTAAVDGNIAGCACLYQMADEGEIINVAVAPKYQGNGIGKMLLMELIKRGTARGITRFILDVRVSNEKAVGLYEKAGFRKLVLQKGFYGNPPEDGWLMELQAASR